MLLRIRERFPAALFNISVHNQDIPDISALGVHNVTIRWSRVTNVLALSNCETLKLDGFYDLTDVSALGRVC